MWCCVVILENVLSYPVLGLSLFPFAALLCLLSGSSDRVLKGLAPMRFDKQRSFHIKIIFKLFLVVAKGSWSLRTNVLTEELDQAVADANQHRPSFVERKYRL